jgi:peptide-methionine (S)-S-oxide reductase
MTNLKTIAFGGGCHWCTEAVFQSLKGVYAVRQGFVRSDPPDHGWSEAVEVDFDPNSVFLDDLIAVHLATHASMSDHKMRGKYRSAVYVFDLPQKADAKAGLANAAAKTGANFVTRVLMHKGFKPSPDSFHNYYATNADRPFCKSYIDPKLAILRTGFAKLMQETSEGKCTN